MIPWTLLWLIILLLYLCSVGSDVALVNSVSIEDGAGSSEASTDDLLKHEFDSTDQRKL